MEGRPGGEKKRTNPVGPGVTKAERAQLAKRVAWDTHRGTMRGLKATEKAAAVERQAELERLRAICERARTKLRATCAAKRETARATARAKKAAAKEGRAAERKLYGEIRAGEERRAREKGRLRKPIERITESDDEVRGNLDPGLWPVWAKVKGSIKGTKRRTRTEAFLQFIEENPVDVIAIMEAAAPTAAEYEREYLQHVEREAELAQAVPF